jgi:transposase-like protein
MGVFSTAKSWCVMPRRVMPTGDHCLARGGQVVIRMLANVQQATLHPIIEKTVAKGSNVYTDEYSIYARLPGFGYGHKTVCHSRGEYARDEDGPSVPMMMRHMPPGSLSLRA